MAGSTTNRWVRVWFLARDGLGSDTLVGSYRAEEPGIAARYADAMSRRYAGLRITVDPMPDGPAPVRELPTEQLWMLVP